MAGIQGRRRVLAGVACPYRVTSFHVEERTVDLRLRCRRRTGADAWVPYHLRLNEDLAEFQLYLEGRNVGTYVSDSSPAAGDPAAAGSS